MNDVIDVELLLNSLERSPSGGVGSSSPLPLESIDASETEGLPDPEVDASKREDSIRWGRFLGERVAQGVLSVADFAKMIAFLPNEIASRYEVPNLHGRRFAKEPKVFENPSSFVNRKARAHGIDLESQGEGNTPTQRVIGKAVQAMPSAILGGPRGLVQGAAMLSGMGAGSQGLQEMGVDPLSAELATLGGAYGVSKLGSSLMKGGASLSDAERKISGVLKESIGSKALPEVSERLKSAALPFEKIAYEPMSAELAGSPALSQMHRARSIMPDSGLSNRSSLQNAALNEALEGQSVKAMHSSEIRDALGDQLKERMQRRRAATASDYQKLEQMTEPLAVDRLKSFLREKPAAGKIRKSLTALKREIKGEKSVAELIALDQDLTDTIQRVSRSGRDKQAVVLSQAQTALRQDLDKVLPYKISRATYADLSEPINEIARHPTLKKILKGRDNEVIPSIFNAQSVDNVKQIKKVFLEENPSVWEGFKDATTKYLKDSVSNAGAEGKHHVFSYAKLQHFLRKHQDALKMVYTPEQMKFVHEFKRALKGQNELKTLGASPGSDTAAKIAINQLGRPGVIGQSLEGLSGAVGKVPIFPGVGKGLGDVLKWYHRNRQDELLKVLDKALLEPSYAHKLMSTPFKDLNQGAHFIEKSLLRSPTILGKKVLDTHIPEEEDEPIVDIQDLLK